MSQKKVCNTVYVYCCHKFSSGRTRFQSIILALNFTMVHKYDEKLCHDICVSCWHNLGAVHIHFCSVSFSLPFVCGSELFLNSFTTQTWKSGSPCTSPEEVPSHYCLETVFSRNSRLVFILRVKAFLLFRSAHKVTHSKGEHKSERVDHLSSIP